jgi:hypothetical protein
MFTFHSYIYVMVNAENNSLTLRAVSLYASGLSAIEIAQVLSISLDQLIQETSKYITF